ncbi:hypothetical protein QCA50_009710 [Cerrena zonata]|uniref:Uncharacterized protein n=1 Tax=Cerrena zonata TaxID=2478898 RepID=A0AAW0GDR7_9APHY
MSTQRRINYCSICIDPVTRDKIPLKDHKCPYANLKGKKRVGLADRNDGRQVRPRLVSFTAPEVVPYGLPVVFGAPPLAPAMPQGDPSPYSFPTSSQAVNVSDFSPNDMMFDFSPNDATNNFSDNHGTFDFSTNDATFYCSPNDVMLNYSPDDMSSDGLMNVDTSDGHDSNHVAPSDFAAVIEAIVSSMGQIGDSLHNAPATNVVPRSDSAACFDDDLLWQLVPDEVHIDPLHDKTISAHESDILSQRETLPEPPQCEKGDLPEPQEASSSVDNSDMVAPSMSCVPNKLRKKRSFTYIEDDKLRTRAHSDRVARLMDAIENLDITTGAYIFCFIAWPETMFSKSGKTHVKCSQLMEEALEAENPEYEKNLHKIVAEYEKNRRSTQKSIVTLNAQVYAEKQAKERAEAEVAALRAELNRQTQNGLASV